MFLIYIYLVYHMHTEHQDHYWCMQRHSWRVLDLCSDYTCSSQMDKDRERDHSDSWEDPEQQLPSSLPAITTQKIICP